ncbi:hypothetical protein B9Z55_023670 [Caenorhabditis nigoni]|uniref:Uncharacterized protein n=1 Tax=Caenorhabditis nigoni TaxID=1611254 RepID=A0A2G5SRF5_9PELO|nr:hypothetical protein B9Z55_023670 [Caenorhabditis nigoni]
MFSILWISRNATLITLNVEADKIVTVEKMKRMVKEVPQFTMQRNAEHQVVAKDVHKEFKLTINKRRISPDGTTLPFGFKN